MKQRPGLPDSVVLVLGLVLALNYVDRSSLSTAAPLLQNELSLSNARTGLLLWAFFWAYTLRPWCNPLFRSVSASLQQAQNLLLLSLRFG
jgi:sugar phosphate permease